jgi:U3 small nucleolar ribonucleoprotein component
MPLSLTNILLFHRSSKITPVINQEYLKTLEDMIIQRIKDSNYDNMIFTAATEKNKQITGEEFTTRFHYL